MTKESKENESMLQEFASAMVSTMFYVSLVIARKGNKDLNEVISPEFASAMENFLVSENDNDKVFIKQMYSILEKELLEGTYIIGPHSPMLYNIFEVMFPEEDYPHAHRFFKRAVQHVGMLQKLD